VVLDEFAHDILIKFPFVYLSESTVSQVASSSNNIQTCDSKD
jgi:hypothetical protein